MAEPGDRERRDPRRRPPRQGRRYRPDHRATLGNRPAFEGPWGFRPPGAPPLPGSGDDEFMWNYAGGWQELFPSVNEACAYRGKQIPFHGEVASLPWEHEILDGDGSDARVRFWTQTRQTPFRVERVLRLREGEAELVVEGVGAERVDGERALRVGSSLRRRAAVSRAGLPARDPRADDRHVTRALGTRDGASRAGSSGAVAVGTTAGGRDGRPARCSRPGGGQPRRSLRHRSRRGVARSIESAAVPDARQCATAH